MKPHKPNKNIKPGIERLSIQTEYWRAKQPEKVHFQKDAEECQPAQTKTMTFKEELERVRIKIHLPKKTKSKPEEQFDIFNSTSSETDHKLK